jgi:hypothetical protein
MMILNLSESQAKLLVMAKLNMAYLSSLKKMAKLLSSSVLSLLPETYSPNGTDNNARDSVLHLNLATFLRDFTFYMTTNDASI